MLEVTALMKKCMVAARLAPVEYLYAHGGLAYEQMKIVEAKPVQSLNSASGHKSKALGVIDFPVKLGAAEKELSFTLTDNLHVNFKLGTANLGTFRTVIDHEMRTMMLKDMAEVLQLGDTRVNETYGIGVASSEQLLPGQQAPVGSRCRGDVVDNIVVFVVGRNAFDGGENAFYGAKWSSTRQGL
ncbi:hypothetical protein PC129_g16885 [Phytophthora cactorum]|uniref:Uncharacterized protein n=2 Tax=Phytophthora cactorum TaxID=29920 RepID=A0A8T1HIZ1_9STRA|nr:hypothetical protein PC115_g16013 [Phytophthora cactorum]KAG3212151.1 hypothetical protein PC129_g16885 [Phytophthora cactorum]KAG4225034.1 hypothetical protein PC116_g26524 [Phytophthora cactorum]